MRLEKEIMNVGLYVYLKFNIHDLIFPKSRVPNKNNPKKPASKKATFG